MRTTAHAGATQDRGKRRSDARSMRVARAMSSHGGASYDGR
jgi:hypothetical protein